MFVFFILFAIIIRYGKIYRNSRKNCSGCELTEVKEMKLKVCEGVEILFSGDSTLIEHKIIKEQFRVGGAGSDFLQLVDGERTFDDITKKLLEIYRGVEPYVLIKDMEDFAHDLICSAIIEVVYEKENQDENKEWKNQWTRKQKQEC